MSTSIGNLKFNLRYKPANEHLDIRDVNSFTLDYPIFASLEKKELEFILEAKNLKEYKKDGKYFDSKNQQGESTQREIPVNISTLFTLECLRKLSKTEEGSTGRLEGV